MGTQEPHVCPGVLIVPQVALLEHSGLFPTKFRAQGGACSFSVTAVTHIPFPAQFPSVPVIPGGLSFVLGLSLASCPSLKPSATHGPRDTSGIPLEGKLDVFRVQPVPSFHRAACRKCVDKTIIACEEATAGPESARSHHHVWSEKGPCWSFFMFHFCGHFL